MTIRKAASIALVAAVGASSPLPVLAQVLAQAQMPPGAVMLVPGVYTTPEISAKCQKYAAKRVGLSGHTDTSRQAVALACAQKLWKQELAKQKG